MESSLVESALDFDIFIFFLFFICNLTLFNLTTWGSFGTQKRKKSKKVEAPASSEFPPQSRVGRFHRNVAFGRAAAPTSPRRGELRRELKLQYVHAQLAPNSNCLAVFASLCNILSGPRRANNGAVCVRHEDFLVQVRKIGKEGLYM